jgi:membrane glycosyltransferase
MRMRQSLAQFEAAFHHETAEDRVRRERLRREAAVRSRVRRRERVQRSGTIRYVVLVTAMLGTTVLVTVAMFRALALCFS